MLNQDNKTLVEFVSYITPDGVEYPIFGGRRSLLSWEGMGMPAVRYLEERGVFQNGTSVRDYRVDARTITVQQFERGGCREDFYCSVGDLVEAIRPNRSDKAEAGQLLVVLKNGAQRTIKARYYDGVRADWGQSALQDSDMLEAITFYCEEPFWDDIEPEIVGAGVLDIGSCTPFCLPACIGSDVINAEIDLIYTGTWDGDKLSIYINGPAISPTVTNQTTGQQIKLNYAVATGETLLIELDPQTQSIVSSVSGVLPPGIVESVSDLVSFYLATRGSLTVDGTNILQITASGGVSGVTSVEVEYKIRHWSLFAPCFVDPFPSPVFYAPYSVDLDSDLPLLSPSIATNAAIANNPNTGEDELYAGFGIQLEYTLPKTLQDKWTVSGWFYPDSISGGQTGFSSDGGVFLRVDSLGFWATNGNSKAASATVSENFVAFTYERGVLSFYLNGILQNVFNAGSVLQITRFSVGCDIGGGGDFFGFIRDVAIFDRVLTPNQIKRLSQDSTPYLPRGLTT